MGQVKRTTPRRQEDRMLDSGPGRGGSGSRFCCAPGGIFPSPAPVGAPSTWRTSLAPSNTAFGGDGGGISAIGSAVILTNSTVSDNNAVGDSGGGIYAGIASPVTLTNSTVSGN